MIQPLLFNLSATEAKNQAPVMPEAYRGKMLTQGEYTLTAPREWTDSEIEWLKQLRMEGYSLEEIAESMGRSAVSIAVKLKRMGKTNNTYNGQHVAEKYAINKAFLKHLKPKDALDVYCGVKSFYKGKVECVTNDKNQAIPAHFHMDALKLLCKLYADNKKFDLVDLDPFGSAYDCLDLAVKLAKRGLIVTLGELGHKRFNRLDYVSTHYGIESFSDFNITNMIQHIQKIGRRNKKSLIVYEQREWRNIGRVWFTIEPLKITSQWQ